MYMSVPFRWLYLLGIFCLPLKMDNFTTIVRFVEIFRCPTRCTFSIFTFSNTRGFENVSKSNCSVSSPLSFSCSSSPSNGMLSQRDWCSRSLGLSQSSWLSCHTYSKSVRFFSFSNSIVFSSLFSLPS